MLHTVIEDLRVLNVILLSSLHSKYFSHCAGGETKMEENYKYYYATGIQANLGHETEMLGFNS